VKADFESQPDDSPEIDRYQVLLEAGTTLLSNLEERESFSAISNFLQTVVQPDFASLGLYEESTHCLHRHVLEAPLAQEFAGPVAIVPVAEAPCGPAFLRGEVQLLARNDLLASGSHFLRRLLEVGIRSACFLPLIARRGPQGTLNLGSTRDNAFTLQDESFLRKVAIHIAIALDNVRAYREVAELTRKLKQEKLYPQDEIRAAHDFDEIVGQSPALKQVLTQVLTVASSDAPVLLLGETGTGKELIARTIHRMSARKDASFIKLNCASVPTGLLESELFGHEKGTFIGAISQKIGRLELADRGTLFLEEVGDVPLELQPKLLHVLQAGEFERLGGTGTIKSDVRVIAATARDLGESVAAGEFRSDLYYRLNVFPLDLPPLRDRGQDIRLLARYFMHKFARSRNKQIETIPREAMRALESWHWPGNVRELANLIERSVILSQGTTLSVPLAELNLQYVPPSQDATLQKLEREHILRVLRETGGDISGAHGAAPRLGMKPATLHSRMQKLGITRSDYQS